MPFTLNLPKPLDDEILLEAQKEGVSAQEHASLALCLVTALLQGERTTPFQEAVKIFLNNRAIDADQVVSVFEELVRVCLDAHESGKEPAPFRKALIASDENDLFTLSLWRDAVVHGSLDTSLNTVIPTNSPIENFHQFPGRVARQTRVDAEPDTSDGGRTALLTHIKSIRGKYAHLGVTSEDLRRERERDEEISGSQLKVE